MSVESMALALHHSKAIGAARLILVGIANHDGDGGAWPSVRTLSKYAGTDPRTVQRHIRKLEELGEIRTEVQAGGRRNAPDFERPNLYHVLVTCPENCDKTKQHRLCSVCADPRYREKEGGWTCAACLAAPVDNSTPEPADPPTETSPPDKSVTPPP